MKLLVFTLSLSMFNSFVYAHPEGTINQGRVSEVNSDHEGAILGYITQQDIDNTSTGLKDLDGGDIKLGAHKCHKHNNLGATTILKDEECKQAEKEKSEGFIKEGECGEKVQDMQDCCNPKNVLSCLTGQFNSTEEAGMLSQITEFVSLSSGGMGGGALILGSSAIKSKGMCSFLELASKAYTAVNTLALGYCGKLIMDAEDACPSEIENPDEKEVERVIKDFEAKNPNEFENLSQKHVHEGHDFNKIVYQEIVQKEYKHYTLALEKSKKELYWYVAKIGSGIYSAYKSNKCQKKIEEQNARNRAQTLARQTKPLHCTSGLMVAYDSKCSDYCAAINHGDPICRNVPRVPGAVRNQYNNSYQAQFNRTNPYFSRNRFLRKDKRSLSSVEKQQKTLFKENKKYTKSLFSKMTQKMNEKLRQNKKNKSSLLNQKYFSKNKKKNNYSYTNNKSSFLTKKDIFQTVSTAYSRICENNSCYRFDEK